MRDGATYRLKATLEGEIWSLTIEVLVKEVVASSSTKHYKTRAELDAQLELLDLGNLDRQRLLDGMIITVWHS
jgi:hypothetical protein